MRKAVRNFANRMEATLKKHDGSGRTWQSAPYTVNFYLFDRLVHETYELYKALLKTQSTISYTPSKKVIEQATIECTDVANFAMMISDNLNEGIGK